MANKTDLRSVVFANFLGLFVFFALGAAGVSTVSAIEILKATAFDDIENWSGIDKRKALNAFRHSCNQMKTDNRAFSKNPVFGGEKADWDEVCKKAENFSGDIDAKRAETFFEANFIPFLVNDPQKKDGLFTGYFEPEFKAAKSKSNAYPVPLYGRPDDLVAFSRNQKIKSGLAYGRLENGEPQAYFTRKKIENGALKGRGLELFWLKSYVDAFFMQIQGSGRLVFENGETIRLAYAGKTGRPYTPIGAVLVKLGALEKSALSMQSIRTWLVNNPDKAREVMWHNESFVFFRKHPDSAADGPIGAQHIPLLARTSLAVDRRYWAFGTPIWLDTTAPISIDGKIENWRNLLVAQDTGSAIRGIARGDVFWGSGSKAGEIAGPMQAPARMIVLLPHKLAVKLKLTGAMVQQ